MDARTKTKRLEIFTERCRTHGVPITYQRRLIFETILEVDDHPTADDVHDAAAKRVPGISRTTIYRTLDTLVRIGVITKACHPGAVVRFDLRTETHHHLVCLACDRIIDISDARLDTLPLPDTSSQGFTIQDFRVQLRGLCAQCRKQEETP